MSTYNNHMIVLRVVALICVVATSVGAQPAIGFTAEELVAHVTMLASKEFEGRRTRTAGNQKAREWLLARFKEAGLTPLGTGFEIPFTFTRNGATSNGVNLVGMCKGKGATGSRAMVISAHYDHLGVRDGAIYHGADDNASGVAVLLGLARHCQASPWRHDALFVAFDAEEQGLQGARAFVATPPIARDRIALNINLDMVARADKGELYAAGTSYHQTFKPVLEPVAARATKVKLLFGHDSGGGQNDWTTQSDHGAFHAAGIPFIYFGVEDHPDYHKPTDTADKIDAVVFFNVATIILDAVNALDASLR